MKKYIHSLLSEEVHPVEETKLSNWNALCQVMQKRLWDSVEQRTIPLPIWHVETLSYRRGLPSQTLSSSKSLLGEWLGKSRKPIWKVAAACPQWSFRDRRGGTRQCVGIEGAQDVPPLNTPLWNIDDLEWKEPGKQQLQGSSPTWCFLPHKRVLEFPLRKVALLYQKESIPISRDWEVMLKWVGTSKVTKGYLHSFLPLSTMCLPVTSPQFTVPAPTLSRHFFTNLSFV